MFTYKTAAAAAAAALSSINLHYECFTEITTAVWLVIFITIKSAY